jgi:hypothetical protein
MSVEAAASLAAQAVSPAVTWRGTARLASANVDCCTAMYGARRQFADQSRTRRTSRLVAQLGWSGLLDYGFRPLAGHPWPTRWWQLNPALARRCQYEFHERP